MGKFLGILASIAVAIFIVMKWGGSILGIGGAIVAFIVGIIFVGGGDEWESY